MKNVKDTTESTGQDATALKRILILFLFLFSLSLSAQTEKGSYIAGGGADISMGFQNKTRGFNFSVSPSFGVFVVRGLAIGGRYSFGISSSSTPNSLGERHATTIFTSFIGPTLKYYLGKQQLKGLISGYGGYQVYTRLYKSSITNYNGFGVGGTLGAAYFFNPHISLEFAAYINAAGYEKNLPSSRGGLTVGFFIFFDHNKKKE